MRVTKDGILDLSAFESTHAVEFGGNLRVIFEPGARVLFGISQATLRWADNATCEFEPVVNTAAIERGSDLTSTNTVRVRLTGAGILEFTDCARADVPRDAFVGIEALPECGINGAFVQLNIFDCAEFHVGDVDCKIPGGALQVGNVVTTGTEDQTISFSLVLDGPKALFEIGPQGFVGFGLGVVTKGHTGHDDWSIAPTANVLRVSLDLQNGIFRHPQVYAGSDDRSSLLALCDSIDGFAGNVFNFNSDPIFEFNYDGSLLSKTSILGGGDFIASGTSIGVFNPVVGTDNGGTTSPTTYLAGVLTSLPLLQEFTFGPVDAFAAQLLLRLQDIEDFTPVPGRAVAAPSCNNNEVRTVYVDRGGNVGDGVIARADLDNIIGVSMQTTVQEHTKELGAVGLSLVAVSVEPTPPRPIVSAFELGT